jgi:NTE family protein
MIAYVLSGGNLRGALQVGALQALLADPARRPDLIAGTSIGAINGSLLAFEPTPAGADQLASIWQSVKRSDIYPSHPLRYLWRLLRGKDHLFPSGPLRRRLRQTFPPEVTTFGDLKIPLYVTVCSLSSSALYVWGDDPGATIVDALLTSASIPGTFPALKHAGYQYVDGGVISNLPLRVAIDRGATEIYALDVGSLDESLPAADGFFPIVNRTIQIMLHHQAALELERAINTPGVVVHHLRLGGYKHVSRSGFPFIGEMIAAGQQQAEAYLEQPTPNQLYQAVAPPPPPGAVQFVYNGKK